MNIFQRNQVVITALVIMIAIAGYLNFTQKNIPDAGDMVLTENPNVESGVVVPNTEEDIEATFDELNTTEDIIIEGDVAESESETMEPASNDTSVTDQPGEAIFTSNPVDISDYFLTAKLNREQSRAKDTENYLAIIDNANLAQEQKETATEELVKLQKRIEKEATCEDLLKAKGFENVYVRILPDTERVEVVVGKQELTDADTAQIMDVVKRTTELPGENIVITPLSINQ